MPQVPLHYCPSLPGGHKGQLELLIPSTGERNVYALSGKGTEPLAEGHIILETQVGGRLDCTASLPTCSTIMGHHHIPYILVCLSHLLREPLTVISSPPPGP